MTVPARVYLLGGSSSVGKTTAGAVIADRLGATHLQVDHIAQASADPRVRRFHVGVDALWSLPAAHLCDLLVQKGEALAEPLHALIRQCLSGSSTTVVEVEPERAALFQTLTKRPARFRALPEAQRHTVAATNWRYGNWLRQQAQQFGQPWLESRPWATLPDRLVQAWHRPTPPIR